jgi:hypothetical protein
LKPLLSKYKNEIQKFIDDIKGSGSDLLKEGVKQGSSFAKAQLNDPSNLMRAA